jgi:hypothetical protein
VAAIFKAPAALSIRSMSALHAIIDTYIRFADEQALLALRAHRLKLLVTIDETNPFFSNLRTQCLEEISLIEAGLVKLRPAPVPVAEVAPPDSAADDPPEQEAAAEPTEDENGAVLAQAIEVFRPDDVQGAVSPAPTPAPSEPRAGVARAVDSSLIASSLLTASLAATEPAGTNLATELVELQLRLASRLKG